MPKGLKGFQKGHKGYRLGTKNKATLLKEERRAIFDKEVSQMWIKTIKKMKPEYLGDQFMGKAPEELIIKGAIQIDSDIAEKNDIASSPKNNSERQA